MDRNLNAGAPEPPDPLSPPTTAVSAHGPLLDKKETSGNPDDNLMCWCCPLYRCFFGGCGENPQPVLTRSLDCIAHMLFWFSGMYHPNNDGKDFSRWRWDLFNKINYSGPGLSRRNNVRSYDSSVPSSYVSNYQVPVRVYHPVSSATGNGVDKRFPLMIFIHGGGFCVGDMAQNNFHTLCNRLSNKLQCVIVSVNYRLAPEHPFPAAIEDCHDVLKHIALNPSSVCDLIDLSRGIVVAGDSAGGNVSCVLASLCRDGLDGQLRSCPDLPRDLIVHQVLIYPALFMGHFTFDEEEFADAVDAAFIPQPVTKWFRASYLPDLPLTKEAYNEFSKRERRLSPIQAGFAGLPPTTIVSAELDQLLPENMSAHREFLEAGVDSVQRTWKNVPHGFATFHFLKESVECLDFIVEQLQKRGWQETRAPQAITVGNSVEIKSLKNARGTVTAMSESGIAEIDLGFGKAHCPPTNLTVI